MAWSAGGMLAVLDASGGVIVYDPDASTATTLTEANGAVDIGRGLAWSADGSILAVAAANRIRLWSFADTAVPRSVEQASLERAANALAWSHRGRVLAAAGDGVTTWAFDGSPTSPSQMAVRSNRTDGVTEVFVAFDELDERVVVGLQRPAERDFVIRTIDAAGESQEIDRWAATYLFDPDARFAMSPTGDRVVWSTLSGATQVYGAARQVEAGTVDKADVARWWTSTTVETADGMWRVKAALARIGVVQLYRVVGDGEVPVGPTMPVGPNRDAVLALGLSPDERVLVAVTQAERVPLWILGDGELLPAGELPMTPWSPRPWTMPPGVNSIGWSADGQQLAIRREVNSNVRTVTFGTVALSAVCEAGRAVVPSHVVGWLVGTNSPMCDEEVATTGIPTAFIADDRS